MKKLSLALVFLLIAFTLVQLWATKDKTNQKTALAEQQKATQEASNLKELTGGETPTGGDFTLTDQDGKTVHDADFRGKVMLVFFGFTRCQDVCPVTVGTLSKTMELLGAKAASVVPIFISVDPEHDKPPVLKDWLSHFDKRIVGLTGTKDQIRDVTYLYKTYYAASPALPSLEPAQESNADTHDKAIEQGENGDDYSIDHSAFISMMGKDGKLVKLFPYDVSEQELADDVAAYLQ